MAVARFGAPRAASPPESKHALDHAALAAPDVTFRTVREDGVLLGCGALRELDPRWGEIKSMRTAQHARGRGMGTLMLTHLPVEARHRGYRRLSLETGAQDYFAPARRLYARHGFTECGPFAGYLPDPNSVYLNLSIEAGPTPESPGTARR